jgi:hypothetical protein
MELSRGRTVMPLDLPHPAFPRPSNEDVKIWRYLDAFKFKWLMTYRRLHMCAAAHLGDPLEGTRPQGDAEWWDNLAASAASDEQRKNVLRNKELMLRFAVHFRPNYFVSCWHLNSQDNPRMWEAYTRSADAVAIQSTYRRLRSVLPSFVEIGEVRYIDYATQPLPSINLLECITHKDLEFSYEAELRAVAMRPIAPGPDRELFLRDFFERADDRSVQAYAPPIEPSELLENVLVPTTATLEFKAAVTSLCVDLGMPPPLESSVA